MCPQSSNLIEKKKFHFIAGMQVLNEVHIAMHVFSTDSQSQGIIGAYGIAVLQCDVINVYFNIITEYCGLADLFQYLLICNFKSIT